MLAFCCTCTVVGLTMLISAFTEYDACCTGDGDQPENSTFHCKHYAMEASSRQKNRAKLFCKIFRREFLASDRLPYVKGPTCNISNLLLVCAGRFDWLPCEDYSVRYCSFTLMYSRSSILWALAVCSAPARR